MLDQPGRGAVRVSVIRHSLGDLESDTCGPSVDPSSFAGPDSEYPNHWLVAPRPWELTPQQALLSQECRAYVEQAIAELPPIQRQVITLRDVQGWSSEEVCNILGVSESNCRVLLHRARSKFAEYWRSTWGLTKGAADNRRTRTDL